MLDHLVYVSTQDVAELKKLPKEDCWVDKNTYDILNTMVHYIEWAPPQVKALTFHPSIPRFDNAIRAACKKKGIIVVWTRGPNFIRYLDTEK